MKKQTYIAKLESTKVLGSTTMDELKVIKKTRASLKSYLRKQALSYVLKTTGRDLMQESRFGPRIDYEFDLKPSGSVLITLTDYSPNWPGIPRVEKIRVRKSLLLS